MSDHSITSLIEKLEAGKRSNEIDIAVELAIFVPDHECKSVRANHAGTKVIYTFLDGSEQTCWARDWSLYPTDTLSILRAQSEDRV
jgi:hypothetical protein